MSFLGFPRRAAENLSASRQGRLLPMQGKDCFVRADHSCPVGAVIDQIELVDAAFDGRMKTRDFGVGNHQITLRIAPEGKWVHVRAHPDMGVAEAEVQMMKPQERGGYDGRRRQYSRLLTGLPENLADRKRFFFAL